VLLLLLKLVERCPYSIPSWFQLVRVQACAQTCTSRV
jgi:hypothetical protein